MSITPFPRPHEPTGGDCPSEEGQPPQTTGFDDHALAQRIATGDTNALDHLISQYWEPLTSYASRVLDDMDLAQDVVQDVFVRVWERRIGWHPHSVRAYLFRATRNLALDEMRSRNALHEREQKRGREESRRPRTPLDIYEDSQLSSVVDAALQALPVRRREAFTLVYLKKLTYAEAAEVMGVSPKTVGHHISAALVKLREKLRPLLAEHFPPAS